MMFEDIISNEDNIFISSFEEAIKEKLERTSGLTKVQIYNIKQRIAWNLRMCLQKINLDIRTIANSNEDK